MAVKREVHSRVPLRDSVAGANPPAGGKDDVVTPVSSSGRREESTEGRKLTKKYCQFCRAHNHPEYWNSASLKRFVNDRGRIASRARTGACSKHQRAISKQIKYARHLGLLPFRVEI